MGSYEDKVAIVTGAGSGIGRGIVERLHEQGAYIVANDLREDRLNDFPSTDRIVKVCGDTSDSETSQRIVTAARKLKSGVIDALFNNAGMITFKPALEYTQSDWDRNIGVNLTAYFLVAQAVGRVMVGQRSGAILNTASTAAGHGVPNNVAYVSAKHGVIGLTRALAIEWACYGVRVNALSPGFTESAMIDEFKAQSPELYGQRVQRIPLGRAGRVDEQAAMALFLNSDEASYTTGMIAVVDGGGHALYSGFQAPRISN